MRSLEKQRRNRFSSAREFGLALGPFAIDTIPEDSRRLVASLRGRPDMKTLVDVQYTAEVPSPVPAMVDEESTAWRAISGSNVREAFERFLTRFPEGVNASAARARLTDMDLVRDVEQMAARADVSGLNRLSYVHGGDSTVGRAIRAALGQARDRRSAEETQEWRDTLRGATREAFQRFERLYPDSAHAGEARVRLSEMDALDEIDGALRRSDYEALKGLAEQHRGSSRISDAARAAIARLADETRRRSDAQQEDQWRAAKLEGSRDSFQRFLDSWPAGSHSLEAQARIGEIDLLNSIERMRAEQDLAGLQRLAATQAPNTSAGIAIRSAIGILEGEARHKKDQEQLGDETHARRGAEDEERDWLAAMQAGSEDGWATYLTRQPSSFRAAQARRFREEAAHFEAALRSGGTPALRAFLQAWPESRFRPHVDQRLRSEDEEDAARAYAAAVRADSEERWKRFLEAYPSSPLAVEATRLWNIATELVNARKTDTIAIWREFIGRHPEDPHTTEARARLLLLENLQKEHINSAISTRNVASVRSILQSDPSPETSELARRAEEEVAALQAAIRSGSLDGLRRFQRNYPEGRFDTTLEYLQSKHEDAAFSLLMPSRSKELAARFIKDYPLSSRVPNVKRMVQELEESEKFKAAMRDIQRGKLEPAREAAASLSDAQMRNTLRLETDRYAQSTGTRQMTMFAGWVVTTLGEQLRGGTREPRLDPTPAMKDLRTAREPILDELKGLAAVLKAEGDRFPDPSASVEPTDTSSYGSVIPATGVQRTKAPYVRPIQTPVREPAREPVRRRGSALPVFFVLLLVLALAAFTYRVLDRDGADKLVSRGRDLARLTLGTDSEKKAADVRAQLQIDALPWGRVTSVKGPAKEYITAETWTPLSLTVPPGHYEVTVVGPDGTSQQSASVEIKSADPQLVRVKFQTITAREYFAEVTPAN